MKYFCVFGIVLFASQVLIAQATLETETLQVSVTELPGELDLVLRNYEKGWRSQDANFLASLFTEDGFILRPGNPAVKGRENIEEAYKGSGGPLFLHAFEYSVSDSVGYVIGGFKTAENNPDAGKFILTLRKVEDRWLITADMDNGNQR